MTTIAEWSFKTLHPVWMRNPAPGAWGSRAVWVGLSVVGSICADMLLRSALSGMVLTEYCREGALALVGRGRNLERYPSETVDQYRSRVYGAWEAWEYAGTERGMLQQLRAAGYGVANLNLVTRDGVAAVGGKTCSYPYPTPDPFLFAIVLTAAPGSPEVTDPLFEDDEIISDDSVIGSSLTTQQCTAIFGLVSKWRTSGYFCTRVCFTSVDDGAIDPNDTTGYTSYIVPWEAP